MVNYDAHHSVGFLGLLPWVVLGLTGAAISYEGVVRPALYRVTRSEPAPPPKPKSAVARGDAKGAKGAKPPPPLPPDGALFFASQSALPGAKVTILSFPQGREGTYLAYMKFPEDHTPAGRSRVWLDQYNGKVLAVENARTAPAGTRLWNLNRPIHTGDIWGWPTRLLACLASFVLAVQSVSGVWMWLSRRRKC
jgi:uncharacterized iron-regulated membrane protein